MPWLQVLAWDMIIIFEFRIQVVAQLKAGGQAATPGSEEAALMEARLVAVKTVATTATATGAAIAMEASSQPVTEVAGA